MSGSHGVNWQDGRFAESSEGLGCKCSGFMKVKVLGFTVQGLGHSGEMEGLIILSECCWGHYSYG